MSGHLYDVDKCRTLLKSQVTILTLVAVGLLVLFVSVVVLSIVEIKNGKKKNDKKKNGKAKKGKAKKLPYVPYVQIAVALVIFLFFIRLPGKSNRHFSERFKPGFICCLSRDCNCPDKKGGKVRGDSYCLYGICDFI